MCVGPVREPELDKLVEQLKSMGFDEVRCFCSVCLSVCVSDSLCVSLICHISSQLFPVSFSSFCECGHIISSLQMK